MRKSEKTHILGKFDGGSLNKNNPKVTDYIKNRKALEDIAKMDDDPDLVMLNGHDQSIKLGSVSGYSVYASYASNDVIRSMSDDSPDQLNPHIVVVDSSNHQLVRDSSTRDLVTNGLVSQVGSDYLDSKMEKLYKIVVMNGTLGATSKSIVNSYNESQRSAMNEKESN